MATRRLVPALCLLGLAAAAPLHADAVKVEIEGLDRTLERNARSALSLILDDPSLTDRLKNRVLAIFGRKDESAEPLEEPQIRRLFAQGPDEIREALQPYGYYKPQIRSDLRQEEKTWIARYEVDPGPPIRFASVDIQVTGAGGGDRRFRDIVADYPVKRGDVLVHPIWEEGKGRLQEVAFESGYIDADFAVSEVRVDMGSYQAVAVLRFDTGPRYLFGEARFNQEVLDPEVLQGYVNFKPGEPLDLNKLRELQNALSDSPYWSRVEVVTRQEEARELRVPIDVNLIPSKPMRFSGGLGYGTDTGARASGAWELRRINRHGHRGRVQTIVSEIQQSLELRYEIPGHYPRTDVLTFSGAYDRQRSDTVESETGLLGAQLTRSRGGWRETYSLSYQREDFEVGLDRGISNLLVPGVGLERVKADDRIDTTKGYRLRLSVLGAEESLLSDASFVQGLVEGKIIRTLGDRHRLIGRTELGYTGTDELRELPPRYRFFAGGDRSVRGYAYQALGREDEAGNVIGGEALLVGSLEYEYRFLERWGAAVFFDAGNAFRDFGGSLEQGAGIGLRWRSPIGPIRADVAWALTEPDRPLRFHINIGPDL